MLRGIDVSHYQTTTPNLTGLDFVFVKATDGLGKDPLYDMHCSNVLKAGKVLGAYAFGYNLSPTFSAEQQAVAFLAFANNTELLALDLESSKSPMSNAQAKAFIAYVHTKGRKIGLYAGDSSFPDLGQDWNWVANWSHTPAHAWTFWQKQGSPLDTDVFNGDLTALLALAGKDDMPGLKFNIVSDEHGRLTVQQDRSWGLFVDGSEHSYFNKGDTAHYIARTRFPSNYGDATNSQDGYLVGTDTPPTPARIMLARNVTAIPDAPIVTSPQVDTAALQKTAFNSAISSATNAIKGLTKP